MQTRRRDGEGGGCEPRRQRLLPALCAARGGEEKRGEAREKQGGGYTASAGEAD